MITYSGPPAHPADCVPCAPAASDQDAVALQSLHFASSDSAGASCQTVGSTSSILDDDGTPKQAEWADADMSDQARPALLLLHGRGQATGAPNFLATPQTLVAQIKAAGLPGVWHLLQVAQGC